MTDSQNSVIATAPGSFQSELGCSGDWQPDCLRSWLQDPDGPNIPFTVPAACTDTFFAFDAASHILTVGAEALPSGNLNQAKAHWLAKDLIAWNVPAADTTVSLLHGAPEGGMTLATGGVQGAATTIPLTYEPAGLPAALREKFPHLAAYPAFRIPAESLPLVPGLLKGQLAVSAVSLEGTLLDATGLLYRRR